MIITVERCWRCPVAGAALNRETAGRRDRLGCWRGRRNRGEEDQQSTRT